MANRKVDVLEESGTGLVKTSTGASLGGAKSDIFYENGQTISADFTITAGKNASTTGSVTINDGVTVTIPSGSTWVIL